LPCSARQRLQGFQKLVLTSNKAWEVYFNFQEVFFNFQHSAREIKNLAAAAPGRLVAWVMGSSCYLASCSAAMAEPEP